MKLILFFSILLFAISAQAQWVVTDPAHTAQTITSRIQDIANHAEVLTEWQQQYEQLTEQINTMTQQLEVETIMKDWMGDPIAVDLPSLEVLSMDDFIDDINYGIPWDEVIEQADGTDSLGETHGGLFEEVPAVTVTGEAVNVTDAALKQYAAVDRQYINYVEASGEIDARLRELQENQALTLTELRNAATDAEVQKLSAIVNAQNGQITLLISEREKQYQQYNALKELSENQEAKSKSVSVKAHMQDQHAAYQSLQNYLMGLTSSEN
ncbi:DUF4141 domain-containing protein [Ruficoccus sp. ZRK36]|uniref:DUF4141 domain-containing protein n=1 Tax=Ruficoccus sp. ZRK36 TaxID=2866311 RepID=UPI001C72D502|nr:DUF4141 domain-containing protein [Ruficoccus sp. ZRK36]QYY35486.1 DUF4141 domain-containing protein [Ruficoccus sp. ZRK36]